MKNFAKLVAIFGIVTSVASAQSTSTSSIANILQTLEESPASLWVEETFRTTPSTQDQAFKNIDNWHEFYFKYKLTKNDELRIKHQFNLTYLNNQEDPELFRDGTELRYKRKNILTQDQYGVDFSAEYRYEYAHDNNRDYAKHNVRLNFDRSFTNKFVVESTLRYDIYQHVPGYNKIAAKQTRFRAYLTPIYYYNDLFNARAEIMWNQNYRTATEDFPGIDYHDKDSYLRVIPSVSWNIHKKVRADFFYEFFPIQSNDGQTLAENFNSTQNSVFGTRLVLTAF